MRNVRVNVYIGALVITVAGSIASIILIGAAWRGDTYFYDEKYFAPVTEN